MVILAVNVLALEIWLHHCILECLWRFVVYSRVLWSLMLALHAFSGSPWTRAREAFSGPAGSPLWGRRAPVALLPAIRLNYLGGEVCVPWWTLRGGVQSKTEKCRMHGYFTSRTPREFRNEVRCLQERN